MMDRDQVEYVRVTNGLDIEFLDRWDGVPVRIPPGASQKISPEMALHFFGYYAGASIEVMYNHTTKRHGWNTKEFLEVDPETKKTKARTYFESLKLVPVVYKLVPAEPDDPQTPVPADREPEETKPRTSLKRVDVSP